MECRVLLGPEDGLNLNVRVETKELFGHVQVPALDRHMNGEVSILVFGESEILGPGGQEEFGHPCSRTRRPGRHEMEDVLAFRLS